LLTQIFELSPKNIDKVRAILTEYNEFKLSRNIVGKEKKEIGTFFNSIPKTQNIYGHFHLDERKIESKNSLRDYENQRIFLNGQSSQDHKTGETMLSYVFKPIYLEEPKWVGVGNDIVKDIFNIL